MTARPSFEELELAPLLDPSSYDSAEMSDKGNHDFVESMVDGEKLENSAAPSFVEVSQEEKRLVRKLDSRIMPIACILYLFACESSLLFCVSCT